MTTIEDISAKIERGEELTSWEHGYHQGYTTAMADLVARQMEHTFKEGEQ